jgi:ribonuclease HII
VIKKAVSCLKRHHEKRGHASHGMPVCGVDEVGRGPLAGPVVAAAVILPLRLPKALSQTIDDSKKLPADVREAVAAELHLLAIVSIGLATVEEIDTINILRASLLAMHRAVDGLSTKPLLALVDGNQKPPLTIPMQMIIGGDGVELAIAAASIVAKVHRDRLMQALHEAHPHYGWSSNVGYSTRHHCEALRQHGATPHHRTSFAPVRAVLFGAENAA